MTQRTEQVNENAAPTTGPVFPRMLTLEQVQEILNVKSPLVYALVRSGALPAGQFGGRGVWRVRESDLAAYIDAAFVKTAERIAAGQIREDDDPTED
ncbi:helix-turn-helix domain-containing protein [Arthrobacter sp. AL12]|uniref:helix-turn-helix domain-containing protein n=1 Tax=Arthrobacter sp. AL12 TaxID=3042241 RepID=UPI00249C360A|nr:helix-turn-helix domain-containing protein [Arthrobacter sp. AL12]MDI3213747.1 helix-turn-helix domain-containing protein [Arthrobacter sp. AL12]